MKRIKMHIANIGQTLVDSGRVMLMKNPPKRESAPHGFVLLFVLSLLVSAASQTFTVGLGTIQWQLDVIGEILMYLLWAWSLCYFFYRPEDYYPLAKTYLGVSVICHMLRMLAAVTLDPLGFGIALFVIVLVQAGAMANATRGIMKMNLWIALVLTALFFNLLFVFFGFTLEYQQKIDQMLPPGAV